MREGNIVRFGIFLLSLVLIYIGIAWQNWYVILAGIIHLFIAFIVEPSIKSDTTYSQNKIATLFLVGFLFPIWILVLGIKSLFEFFNKLEK